MFGQKSNKNYSVQSSVCTVHDKWQMPTPLQNILQIRGQDEDPLSKRAQKGGSPEE